MKSSDPIQKKARRALRELESAQQRAAWADADVVRARNHKRVVSEELVVAEARAASLASEMEALAR